MRAAKEVDPLAFKGRCFFTNKHLVISVVWDIVDNSSNQLLLLQNGSRDKHSKVRFKILIIPRTRFYYPVFCVFPLKLYRVVYKLSMTLAACAQVLSVWLWSLSCSVTLRILAVMFYFKTTFDNWENNHKMLSDYFKQLRISY